MHFTICIYIVFRFFVDHSAGLIIYKFGHSCKLYELTYSNHHSLWRILLGCLLKSILTTCIMVLMRAQQRLKLEIQCIIKPIGGSMKTRIKSLSCLVIALGSLYIYSAIIVWGYRDRFPPEPSQISRRISLCLAAIVPLCIEFLCIGSQKNKQIFFRLIFSFQIVLDL